MLITDHLKDQRHNSPETVRHAPRATEPRVLIADDQADVLEALRLLLKGEGFTLETASSPAGVLAAVEAREFDVALIDLNYARDTTSGDRKSTRLNSSHGSISYAVFCLKKKNIKKNINITHKKRTN